MRKTSQTSAEPIIPESFTFGGLLLIFGWLAVLLGFGLLSLDATAIETAATIGDAFGSLNSLFSILALLAVIAGTLIQGKEFRKQLEEMTRSAAEMEKQTATYEAQLIQLTDQTDTLKEQLFQERLSSRLKDLPFFHLERFENPPHNAHIVISNQGATVFNLSSHVEDAGFRTHGLKGPSGVVSGNISRVKTDDHFQLRNGHDHAEIPWPIHIVIVYVLSSGERMNETLEIGNDTRGTSNRQAQADELERVLRATPRKASK